MEEQKILFRQGYLIVPFPDTFKRYAEHTAMTAWKNFCAQDLAHKQEFRFVGGSGYEYKDEKSRDYKENFHYSLGYQKKLTVALIEADRAFLQAAETLIRESASIVRDMGNAFGDGMGDLMVRDIDNWVLRFLHYPARRAEPGIVIAASHVDKGVTLHLAEDKEGLEVWWGDRWQHVPSPPDGGIAYAGMLGQYYTGCKLPALCHRVVALPETLASGRSTIVLFIDFGDVRYDKETWGSTQERFPQGENYDMPFDVFAQFFKKKEEALVA